MVVIVELFLFDNLFADLAICLVSLYCLKEAPSLWRIGICLLLGVIEAFIMLYLEGIWLTLFRFFSLFSTTALLMSYRKVREYFVATAVFAALSFLFGGAVYFLFGMTVNEVGVFVYSHAGGVGLFALGITLAAYLIRQLWLMSKRRQCDTRVDVVLSVKGKHYRMKGLIDSGNFMLDNEDRPVCVISEKYCYLFEDIEYEYVLAKTVSGADMLKTIKADEIIIKGTTKNVVKAPSIALSKVDFSDYSILLGAGIRG